MKLFIIASLLFASALAQTENLVAAGDNVKKQGGDDAKKQDAGDAMKQEAGDAMKQEAGDAMKQEAGDAMKQELAAVKFAFDAPASEDVKSQHADNLTNYTAALNCKKTPAECEALMNTAWDLFTAKPAPTGVTLPATPTPMQKKIILAWVSGLPLKPESKEEDAVKPESKEKDTVKPESKEQDKPDPTETEMRKVVGKHKATLEKDCTTPEDAKCVTLLTTIVTELKAITDPAEVKKEAEEIEKKKPDEQVALFKALSAPKKRGSTNVASGVTTTELSKSSIASIALLATVSIMFGYHRCCKSKDTSISYILVEDEV